VSKTSFSDAFNELLFARIANKSTRINLSSGNPSFPPYQRAVESCRSAVERSNIQLYATGAGYKAERVEVLPFCERQGIRNLSVDNIVFGMGVTHLYYSSLFVLQRKFQKEHPGKKPVILMSSPSYGLFTVQPEMFGYEIETYPLHQENSWEPQPEIIERRIKEINQSADKRVALAYNINPHNSTGSVTKPETTEKIAQIFSEQGVFVLDDMAYYGLEYSGNPTPLGVFKFDNSISFYSCSKAFGLPRLRAGFACGPSWLVSEIYGHISSQMISLPATVAPLIKECFGEKNNGDTLKYLEENRQGYKTALNLVRAFFCGVNSYPISGEEKDVITKALREGVANRKDSDRIIEYGTPEIEMVNPDLEAGYFAMLKIKGIDDHFYGTRRLRNAFDLAVPLIDNVGVLMLPLSCAVNTTHTDICRVTFGGMSNRRVIRGLQGMVNTIRQLPTAPDHDKQRELVAANLQIDDRFDIK